MKHKIESSVNALAIEQRFAVGNDLVCLSDFKLSLTTLFKNKVYTASEIDYCDSFSDPVLRYASTWAAKEAVYKAAKQLDKAPLSWKKIEIIRNKPAGQPTVVLPSALKHHQVSLSISHDGDYVWALALIDLTA